MLSKLKYKEQNILVCDYIYNSKIRTNSRQVINLPVESLMSEHSISPLVFHAMCSKHLNIPKKKTRKLTP